MNYKLLLSTHVICFFYLYAIHFYFAFFFEHLLIIKKNYYSKYIFRALHYIII